MLKEGRSSANILREKARSASRSSGWVMSWKVLSSNSFSEYPVISQSAWLTWSQRPSGDTNAMPIGA